MTVEAILAQWRDAGGRITTGRRLVVSALVEAGAEHLTAGDLAERIGADHPDVNPSTVYRTLDALTELGVIEHVHLGHGAAVYHLAESAHHHLLCETCGTVVDVPLAPFTDLAEDLHARYGFVTDPAHFALVGQCADCAGSTDPPDLAV